MLLEGFSMWPRIWSRARRLPWMSMVAISALQHLSFVPRTYISSALSLVFPPEPQSLTSQNKFFLYFYPLCIVLLILYFLSPAQLRKGSDRAALVGTWPPARVNPLQLCIAFLIFQEFYLRFLHIYLCKGLGGGAIVRPCCQPQKQWLKRIHFSLLESHSS